MSIAEIVGLPERIQCEQDITDILDAFEASANAYIVARLAKDDPRKNWREFFMRDGTRWVSDHQRSQFAKLEIGDPRSTLIPQSLINEVNKLRENLPTELARARKKARAEVLEEVATNFAVDGLASVAAALRNFSKENPR